MLDLEMEKKMYGTTLVNLKTNIENSITYRFSGIGMIICGYMSDVQEMVSNNENNLYDEAIRQNLNICKMLMMEYKLGFNEREAA